MGAADLLVKPFLGKTLADLMHVYLSAN